MHMDDIFAKEEKIIIEAEKLMESKSFTSVTDEALYGNLLDEYRKMLKQVRSLIKLGDMMQGQLNALTSKLDELSKIDELTGLSNRRSLNETYQKEWLSAVRSQTSLGILMIDIDYFKTYNDTFGHLQGDWCLQKIAHTIQESIKRPRDFVARFGGEEFIVLLPNTSLDGCSFAAERILSNIESLNIPNSFGDSPEKVSVSIGIGAMMPTKDMEPEILLHVVDEALYRAKNDGRNCCRS